MLGMDRFGVDLTSRSRPRADIVVELCRRGYTDRMVLSHDASCYIDWIDPSVHGLPAATGTTCTSARTCCPTFATAA